MSIIIYVLGMFVYVPLVYKLKYVSDTKLYLFSSNDEDFADKLYRNAQ